jgi:hypothetical protein
MKLMWHSQVKKKDHKRHKDGMLERIWFWHSPEESAWYVYVLHLFEFSKKEIIILGFKTKLTYPKPNNA